MREFVSVCERIFVIRYNIYICCCFFYIKVFFLFKISFWSLSFSLRPQNKRTTLQSGIYFCYELPHLIRQWTYLYGRDSLYPSAITLYKQHITGYRGFSFVGITSPYFIKHRIFVPDEFDIWSSVITLISVFLLWIWHMIISDYSDICVQVWCWLWHLYSCDKVYIWSSVITLTLISV